MTLIEFQDFLDKLLNHMKQKAAIVPDYFTHRNGDGFEICVVEMANEVIQENNLQIVLHHTPGSHAFPDIVVESENGEKYGIEVKSSKSFSASNWTINGNSVVGSTSDLSVIDTYILLMNHTKNTNSRYWTDEERIEWQANAFSSAILMPKSSVVTLSKDFKDRETNPVPLIWTTSDVFNVSGEAATYRLKTLHLIPSDTNYQMLKSSFDYYTLFEH